MVRKRAKNKSVLTAQALTKARVKYANHKYKNNILRRIKYDCQYHEIKIKHHNQIVCAYCGMPATGVDHFIPLSQVEEYIAGCERKGQEPKLFKVSCCAECNRLLGPSTFSTFEIKLNHLRKRLKKKYLGSDPNDKVLQGRLRRRLIFDRGLKRITGVKLGTKIS